LSTGTTRRTLESVRTLTDYPSAGHVLVLCEESEPGRAALLLAQHEAQSSGGTLTVLAIATHERVIGCGRCVSGTVLWNIEMKKMAQEALLAAHALLDERCEASFELQVARVGEIDETVINAARRTDADLVVLPWRRQSRMPRIHHADHLSAIAAAGPWRVISGPQHAPELSLH
jgi:nucleotide-binding universal stress UspA family protein